MSTKGKEKITLEHPKIHLALTSYMRSIGTDAAFKENELIEKRINNMTIHFNDNDKCYTTDRAIFIGRKYPYLTGTLDEQYNTAAVEIGRKVAEVRFTDRFTWNRFIYRARSQYRLAYGFATDILSILEGRRTEYLMAQIDEFLEKGFHYLNTKIADDLQKEVENKGNIPTFSNDSLMKLKLIRSAIFSISVTRIIPKIQDDDLRGYVERCSKYVLYARRAQHTSQVVKATEKILHMVQPLIQEFNATSNEDFEAFFRFKDVGSMSPSSSNDFSSVNEPSELVKFPKELEEKIDKLNEKVKEELEDKEEEKSSEENKTGTSGFAQELEDLSNDVNADIRDYVDDITGNLLDSPSIAEQFKSELSEVNQKMQEPVTKDLLYDLLNATKKEKKQQVKEQREEKLIQELKPTIRTELHKGVKAEFKPREKMFQLSYHEYVKMKEELEPIIRKAARQIQDIAQLQVERSLRNRKRGKLDKKKLIDFAVFNDQKIFKKRRIEEKDMEMDVLLLVDVSGSNGTQMLNKKNDTYVARYIMNQIVAIVLHEILKRVKFKHSIWTFYEGGGGTRFSTPIDRSNCFDKQSGLYLKEIGAWGSNRDGFAIRYAGEYLNKYSDSEKRLLIVLSDGQPAAEGYGGMEAVQDVKQAVKEVEEAGAKVFGIFTGSESENKLFKQMYENRMIVDNETIFELPKMLRDLLVREFEEYINGYKQ